MTVSGELEISLSYTLTTKGIMLMTVQDYVLRTEMPSEDIEELFSLVLQNTIPIEIFDANETSISTTVLMLTIISLIKFYTIFLISAMYMY
jgi:hypothetical protein